MEIYLWLKPYGCFCRKIILEVGESLFFMKFVMWHLKLSFTHKCLHNIFNLYILTFIILQYTTLTLLYLIQNELYDLKLNKHVNLVWYCLLNLHLDRNLIWQIGRTFFENCVMTQCFLGSSGCFWYMVFTCSKVKKIC